MSLKADFEEVFRKTLEHKILFLLFLFLNLFDYQLGSYVDASIYLTILMILDALLHIFLMAGYYGIVFLKINSEQINTKFFIKLGIKNFWGFIKITIFVGFCSAILSWLFNKMLFLIPEQFNTTVKNNFDIMPKYIMDLVFVFSYPLVVLEYFSEIKLKPFETSVYLVVRNAKKIMFIFVVVGIQFALSLFAKILTRYDSIVNNMSWLTFFIQTVLSFLILIYSYLKLTECFYKKLKFNFNRHTT